MTPTIDPKALEAAARAICEIDSDETWDDEIDSSRAHFRWLARAAVSAYLAATPSDVLWIGEYMLQRGPTNGIWIGRRGGEGGQFATDDVERVIAQFYRENF